MSDLQTPTTGAPPTIPAAAPVAPATPAVEPVVPVVQDQGKSIPLTASEAKRALLKNLKVLEVGTPTDGIEATPPEAVVVAPEEGDMVVPGEEPGIQGETAEPEAAAVDAVPEGMVVLEIPEGHPLRDRGKKELPPIPKDWEPEFRNFLNDPVRRADLAHLEEEVGQSKETAMQWERVAGFYVDKLQKILADPSIAVQAAELRAERGDMVANAFIEHVLNQDADALRKLLSDTSREFQATEVERKAVAFTSKAIPAMAKHFPLLGPERARVVLQNYANELDAGKFGGQPTWPTLKSYAATYYEAIPEVVQARTKAQQDAAEQKRLADEAQRKSSEEAVAAHKNRVEHNPLGRLPRAASSQATSGTSETPGNVNVREIKKKLLSGR